jgi:hypothetical protein
LVVEHVLQTGNDQLVETPTGVDHRHPGPEMIKPET